MNNLALFEKFLKDIDLKSYREKYSKKEELDVWNKLQPTSNSNVRYDIC